MDIFMLALALIVFGGMGYLLAHIMCELNKDRRDTINEMFRQADKVFELMKKIEERQNKEK